MAAGTPNQQVFLKFRDPGTFREVGVAARLARHAEHLAVLKTLPGIVDARPLFTRPPEELLRELAALESAAPLPDLTTWFRLRAGDVPAAIAAKAAFDAGACGANESSHHPLDIGLQAAWQPSGVRTLVSGARVAARTASRRIGRLFTGPPNDQSRAQRYLLSAPWGIGAVDVPGWHVLAGLAGVRIGIVDDYFEEGHEDLYGVTLAATSGVYVSPDDHGTETVGVLLAQPNGHGLVGIATSAELVFSHLYTEMSDGGKLHAVADAIERSIPHLRAGDVLLVERQAMGKPVEIEHDCHDAIRHAVARGIIVVEAAGNGGENIDADLFQPESGSILVGAGREATPQTLLIRSRHKNSAYGTRVHVQGHGDQLATLRGKTYTKDGYGFWLTSAASAIVAGVAVIASSVAKLVDPNRAPISPARMRELMRATGSPQEPEDAPDPIGPLPNLPALLRAIRLDVCRRHDVATVPRGAKPALSAAERRLLRLAGSGLDAAAMDAHLGRSDSAPVFASAMAKLGATTPLEAVGAAEGWGFL